MQAQMITSPSFAVFHSLQVVMKRERGPRFASVRPTGRFTKATGCTKYRNRNHFLTASVYRKALTHNPVPHMAPLVVNHRRGRQRFCFVLISFIAPRSSAHGFCRSSSHRGLGGQQDPPEVILCPLPAVLQGQESLRRTSPSRSLRWDLLPPVDCPVHHRPHHFTHTLI